MRLICPISGIEYGQLAGFNNSTLLSPHPIFNSSPEIVAKTFYKSDKTNMESYLSISYLLNHCKLLKNIPTDDCLSASQLNTSLSSINSGLASWAMRILKQLNRIPPEYVPNFRASLPLIKINQATSLNLKEYIESVDYMVANAYSLAFGTDHLKEFKFKSKRSTMDTSRLPVYSVSEYMSVLELMTLTYTGAIDVFNINQAEDLISDAMVSEIPEKFFDQTYIAQVNSFNATLASVLSKSNERGLIELSLLALFNDFLVRIQEAYIEMIKASTPYITDTSHYAPLRQFTTVSSNINYKSLAVYSFDEMAAELAVDDIAVPDTEKLAEIKADEARRESANDKLRAKLKAFSKKSN